MIKKRSVTPAAAGGQLPANDISTKAPAQHLPDRINLLARETIDQLNAIAAELRQKIAVMDANQATSAERTENSVKNADLRTADLNQVKMSHLIACRKKGAMNRDLDEKIIELTCLEERIRSSLHTFAQELTSIAADVTQGMEICLEENSNLVLKFVRNMEEMKCQNKKKIELLNAEDKAFTSKISDLEEKGMNREELHKEKGDLLLKLVRELEELRSRELELLIAENKAFASKIFALEEKGKKREELLKEKADLVLKLVREMEELRSRKEKELELLIAENTAVASKISKKEIGDRLRDEVLDEPRKENSTLIAGSEEIEKDLESSLIDEPVEFKTLMSQLLAKHDIACGMSPFTQLKIDESKSKMTAKNIVDEKRAEHEVRMSNLAYRSWIEKYDIMEAEIVSMQRELKMKAVDLRLQFMELKKGRQNCELMCSHPQLDLNGLTRESVEMRTHIDYLTAEKASLEKHLETSKKELKDVRRTLMASVSSFCSVLSKLKKTATEAVGHEGAQDNCIRGHPPGEILVIHGGMGGDSERPSSLARLRRLVASSSTEGVGNPYNDAVVIRATIENILVYRVLIDSGSSVNVLYKRAFEKMGLDPRTLIPPECPQFDSFGGRWEADGIVILPVRLGDDRGKYTRMTRFHVFDGPDHYNAIFGRPLLNDFQAIVYTYNLTMQFPADGRQVIIRGDVISARECYLRAVGGLEDSAQSKEGESRN